MMPNGEMKFMRMEVLKCPDKEVVAEIFDEKVSKKELLSWGGTCFLAPGQKGVSA